MEEGLIDSGSSECECEDEEEDLNLEKTVDYNQGGNRQLLEYISIHQTHLLIAIKYSYGKEIDSK